jgi:hypothetical protein
LQVSVTLAAMLGVWGFSARLHENGGVKYFVPGLGALACLGSALRPFVAFSVRHTYGWDIMRKRRFVFVEHNCLGFVFVAVFGEHQPRDGWLSQRRFCGRLVMASCIVG